MQIINCCIYITLGDLHYYMSLGNKSSSKDGVAHSISLHTKAYYLSLMELRLIKANFGKAKCLSPSLFTFPWNNLGLA